MQKLDSVERDYVVAIARAVQRGDGDYAYELSIGLKQYREMYKIEAREEADA